MSLKKKGLGRGLDALLSTSHAQEELYKIEPTPLLSEAGDSEQQICDIEISKLQPGKYQPRKVISEQALKELSVSIDAQGLIQPIVVRELAPQHYEIIAGERRWRACQLLKHKTVPCLIKKMTDQAAIAVALIENIQREDLNVMEQARALLKLIEECHLTHQEISEAIGKSRSSVTNMLRLNQLEPEVKKMLEHGDIEMGRARSLLALKHESQLAVAHHVVAKDLNVRETERHVKKTLEGINVSEAPQEEDYLMMF